MATYVVMVQEVLNHSVEVEADSEEEAREHAIAEVVEDSDASFFNVEDRYVTAVSEKGHE
jgi:hypothetical protein